MSTNRSTFHNEAAMPSIERETSRDSDRFLKHQHSASSDNGRALVPMWDSSDPERAPPPLPMNPSSPIITSRPNTSNAIKSAHAALTEKARESAYPTTAGLRQGETSPERSLIKGAAHKRMQSLQTGSVRDLSSFLESGSNFNSPKSPDKNPARNSSPKPNKEVELKSPEKESTSRSSTPTPGREIPTREMPHVRPSLRRPPQSILGENTPPQSATMLALQNIATRDLDTPLSSVTNGSNALVRVPQTFDAISNQILSLTSIATSLQREMTNLSRRSKDNATDLVSLKEATNARDEDIRKSLRELVTNLSESGSRSTSNIYGPGLFLDNKAHNPHGSPTSRNVKQFSLPRIPSPESFSASLDRDSMATPVSFTHEGGATIALLEKVLREMGTKEGQGLLVSRLTEISERLAQEGASTATKLDELIQFIKNPTSQEIIAHNGGGAGRDRTRNVSFDGGSWKELGYDESRVGPMTKRVGALLASGANKENLREGASNRASSVVNDEILAIIRTVKDSVAQGGGLTAEVKALVRELRGEVLGMGREIGRKLEESKVQNELQIDPTANADGVARIVQDGLDELKQHMDHILRENRRQSASSSVSRNVIDYQEIYNAVRAAVREGDRSQEHAPLEKEDIIDAVKEAWENYKPDIELQHFGLEKDELLACLKEGIQEYAPQDGPREMGATREEVFTAVVEGLKHFPPPRVETEASMSREEILDAVRECLEEFEFPSAPPPEPREPEITRDDMLGAVREGLHTFDFAGNSAPLNRNIDEQISRNDVLDAVRDGLESFDFMGVLPSSNRDINDRLNRGDVLEALKEGLESFDFAANAANTTALSRDLGGGLTRDDLFDAVRAGFEESSPLDVVGQQIIERLHDVMNSLQTEFKAVSDEAKQNVAAHGRDTEQVLDATKDGFEKLRSDIESYVDQAADVTGKDEILDSIRENYESLRAELEVLISKGSADSYRTVQNEFEQLRESMATSVVRGGASDKDEIVEALRDGLESLRADIERPRDSNESILSGTGEILDALHDGLTALRSEVEKVGNKPVDMTVNYEILDTLKSGLEEVRADIDSLRESSHGERAMAEITEGAVVATEGLKRNDIENLEVLITQLRIKVDALESMPPSAPQTVPGSLSREDLAPVENSLRNLQDSVAGLYNRERSADQDSVKREDVAAIETLLRNTKAKLDEMQTDEAMKKDHLDLVEALILEAKEGLSGLSLHLDDVSKKDDINIVEALVRDIGAGLEEMRERATKYDEDTERVTKTDVEAVEAVCLDIKSAIEHMLLADIAALASKDDVKNLGDLVKEFKDRIETHAETNAKSFEERQAETVGVGERVTEIKTFLEEFKDAIREKLDEGTTSVEALGKFLESLGETVGQNATITDDIKTLAEAMREEFEKSNAGVVGSKLEADENFEKTWNNLESVGTKCDEIDLKLEEKFQEIMTKYDDAQIAAETKAKLGDEKNAEAEATLLGTKVVAEELKSFIETLGTTIAESTEKMDEASKTVFSRVNETFTRVEEVHADAKAEHQLTREQVFKSISAIESVQGNVTEYNPKILESIKDILLIVGQHYEHSKTTTTEIQEKIDGIPPPAPPVEVPLLREADIPEKYDDAQVHEKLDKLVDKMHEAERSASQLEKLDKIHQQVIQTAAEVSQFVSAQTQRIANDHEDREKSVQDATIALDKRIAQKESVEAHVVGLREEEEHLKESVSILKAEQEDLTHQKMRLSADLSSLETALRIRREELHAMEARAEGLERRILEGVIDHSRSLLISKTNKGRDAMSRKRVPSHTTSITGSVVSSVTSRASNSTHSAVSMAMGGNRAIMTAPLNNPSGASRRILSLNQITNNVPNGGSAFKRSHSVKAPNGPGAIRKSSWGGSLSRNYGELNKENLALKETEEEDDLPEIEDDASDSGTMRRSSRGDTILTSTDVSESIDGGTEWTESTNGDEFSESGELAPMVLYEDDDAQVV